MPITSEARRLVERYATPAVQATDAPLWAAAQELKAVLDDHTAPRREDRIYRLVTRIQNHTRR
ncbi:hypothetical protein ACIRD2_03165 [Streptomyces sp. NPDC093595]|uniref:hypothetical protein n=1 Tax=Streptomyces sp. NPDC093595 TaxID=3366045 RepID=UPI0038137D0C